MTNRNLIISGIVVIIIAIGIGYWALASRQTETTNTPPTTTQTTPPATGTTPPPDTNPTPATSTYENGDLKVIVPQGWTATEATQHTYVGTSTTPTVTPNPAAVNIRNGKWILYINTNASQASGVEGGRFAEIGMGAPSVDAVITVEPDECGTTETHAAYGNFSRVDYTMSAADKRNGCVAPTNGKTVWFFSYLTSPGNGFFNDYVKGQNPALVVTMAYDSKVVNDLPVAGSNELTAALKAMTDIAKTLVVKNH